MSEEVREEQEVMVERRAEDRFDLSRIGVWFKNAADKNDPKIPFRLGGSLTDFSSRGLGIVTKEPLKKEDELILRLKWGGKQMHALGRVVRRNLVSGRDYEVGVELDASEREFIPKLILSYCREQQNKQPMGIYWVHNCV